MVKFVNHKNLSTNLPHDDGVNPSVETVSISHTLRFNKFPSQSNTSGSESPLAGEAEASSAGEQLAKE